MRGSRSLPPASSRQTDTRRVLGQARREHAPGRARADDDVVEGIACRFRGLHALHTCRERGLAPRLRDQLPRGFTAPALPGAVGPSATSRNSIFAIALR